MADNVIANAGSGGSTFATDDIGGVHYPINKIAIGALDSQTLLTGGNGTTDAGTVRVTISSDTTGVLSVDDNGGSLTVDATALDIRALTNADVITAELSATDNAVLDNIDTNTTGLDTTVGTDGAAGPAGALSIGGTESGGNFQEVRVDTDGHLQVDVLSGGGGGTAALDSNNSSTTPLGISGVFTGTSTDVSTYGSVSVQVWADQASATDGLSMEWSIDGTNWDVMDRHTIAANNGEQFIIPRPAQFFRIVYTNGGVGQTGFRLETWLNPWAVSGEIEELDIALDDKDLALTCRSVIAGETPGGDYANVQVSTSGNFKIDVEEWAGNAVTTNTGAVDAGTLRVSVATDDVVSIDDNGGSLTVDASALDIRALTNADIVTAELSAVDNAVLDSIATNTTGLDTTVGTDGAVGPAGAISVGGTESGGNLQEVRVDADGHLQVDVLSGGGSGPTDVDDDAVAAGQSPALNIAMAYMYDGTDWSRAASGTGVRTLQTQRVTIATDDVVPASQSGTWNITNVSGTVSLPTGAATEATLGTIDTDTGNIAAGYAVEGAALGSGVLIQGDDGVDRTNVLVDTDGHLQVDILSGGGGGTQDTEDDAIAAGQTVGINVAMNYVYDGVDWSRAASGTGVRTAQTQRVTIATDDVVPASQSGTWNITNISGTVSLPTGAATEATLGTIDTDTGNIAAGYATEGSALGSGVLIQGDDGLDRTNVLVDTDGHLQVDVLTGGGGGTQDTEDDAIAAGQTVGINVAMAYLYDGVDWSRAAAGTGAVNAQTQRVTIATDDTVSVDNAGTFAVQEDGAALTALQKLDNIAHAGADVALVEHVPISGQFDDVATTTVTENQIAPVRITSTRALHVEQQGTVTVSATALDIRALTNSDVVTAELSATDNTVLDNIDTSTAALATTVFTDDAAYTQGTDEGVVIMGVYTLSPSPVSTNGDAGALRMDSNRALYVVNSGSFATQEDGLALTSLELIDDSIVAHDASASTASVNMSGLEARSTENTAVANGDGTKAIATTLGKQVIYPYAIPASTWSYATATLGVTDTADDAAKTAAGAGIRNYVTSVQVINGHATVATEVVIKDGSTVLWRGWAEAVGGGVSAKFDPPLRGTANTAINVANITTGSKTYFNLQGFESAE